MSQRGKRLAPGQTYSGRRPDISVINLSMLREDIELLRHYSGGKRCGAFVAGLVREYHGKQLEKQRLQAALQTALEGTTTAV
jgi:hypothetical protein